MTRNETKFQAKLKSFSSIRDFSTLIRHNTHHVIKVLYQSVYTRDGVEDTRLEAKAKDSKKIRGQVQGQPFRGQALSRPRTGKLEAKDQGHSAGVLKKRSLKSFSDDLQFIGVPKILDWERPKPQITFNDVIKNFQKKKFCGTKIS